MYAHRRPEENLILHLARSHISPERQAHILATLRLPFDWQHFLQTAASHGVLSLIYWNLHQYWPALVPQPILDSLKLRFMANAANNLQLIKEAREIVDLFARHNIRTVAYKGLVLAQLAYENLDLREISDLDFFARKQDLPHIVSLLLPNGYSLVKPGPSERPREFERYSYHYSFRREKSDRLVEIHWRFVSDPRILTPDDDWPWRGVRPILIEGAPMPCFSPEDLLLLLCAHGCKHWWFHLSSVCDVTALIDMHHDLDWAYIEQAASARNARRQLLLGLMLSANLLQADVPERLLNRARADAVVASLAEEIATRIFERGPDGRFPGVEGITRDIRLRDRSLDKARYVFQYLFAWQPNDHDRAMLNLHPSLAFIYRLLRPARLAREYGVAILRRLLQQFSGRMR